MNVDTTIQRTVTYTYRPYPAAPMTEHDTGHTVRITRLIVELSDTYMVGYVVRCYDGGFRVYPTASDLEPYVSDAIQREQQPFTIHHPDLGKTMP